MKPYLIIFNKEITDTDKLFGFQVMSKEQAMTYLKAVKKLENNAEEFELNGENYEYLNSDFEIQSISQQELKILSKIFEFDYDQLSGESPVVGVMPDAIEQFYYEYSSYDDEDENENEGEDEY